VKGAGLAAEELGGELGQPVGLRDDGGASLLSSRMMPRTTLVP
jgi:hypothetical protein